MERKDINPKVTVALPVYNVESYIRECLESVVNQTMPDIEIICVNDASEDGSMEIVREYAEKDSRFVIINKAHEGLSVSRNVSIDAARGEYIYFLDCDDYISLNALETLYTAASANDLDILYFDGCAVFDKDSLKKTYLYETEYIKQCPASGVLTGQELLAHFTIKNYKGQTCMQFYKLDFLKSKGLRFYPGLIHQDNLFTGMSIMSAQRAQYIKEVLYYRRIRDDSTMTAMDLKLSFSSIMTVIVEFLRYMDKETIDPAARMVFAAKMRSWVDRAVDRYRELEGDINLDEVFGGDQLKHQIFTAAILPQIVKTAQPREEDQELKALKNSLSFKIGRAITFLPRMTAKLLGVARS